MSDAGNNFISDKFRMFCSKLNIQQAVSSAYHHQSNGQVEACIKFIKCTLKKCADSGGDIQMALLQIFTTPLGQGLPSPATLLFNCPVHSIMPVIDRKPIGRDNDDKHHSQFIHRQHKKGTNNDASPVFASIPIGSTIAVQWEDSGLWTHGTIVGKGDHRHHDWSYIIQVTTTGRRITCNRQHIRLTSITADEYICYQTTKHTNRQIDPLHAILEHIKTIQYHTQTGPSRTIVLTLTIHMMNINQKVIRWKGGRNTHRQQ